MNVVAWTMSPAYGIASLISLVLLVIFIVVLVVCLPAEHSERLFRGARLLLDRVEPRRPPAQPAVSRSTSGQSKRSPRRGRRR